MDSIAWFEKLSLSSVRSSFSCQNNNQAIPQPLCMVFGTTLRLPGKFFDKSDYLNRIDATNYVLCLENTMTSLILTFVGVPTNITSQNNADFDTCSHDFLRRDDVRKPLHSPIRRVPLRYSNGPTSFWESMPMGDMKPYQLMA